jgi:hypothetical protein
MTIDHIIKNIFTSRLQVHLPVLRKRSRKIQWRTSVRNPLVVSSRSGFARNRKKTCRQSKNIYLSCSPLKSSLRKINWIIRNYKNHLYLGSKQHYSFLPFLLWSSGRNWKNKNTHFIQLIVHNSQFYFVIFFFFFFNSMGIVSKAARLLGSSTTTQLWMNSASR